MTSNPYSRTYVSPYEGQKGPNGRLLCRECGTETKPPRRTFCSDPCVQKWNERSPTYQRRLVLERDKGVCASCGLDCLALEQEGNRIGEWVWLGGPRAVRALEEFRAFIAKHNIPRHKHGHHSMCSLWEMDHIKPVIEGGGGCTIENLRTLCWLCHKVETALLRKRLAEARRASRA